MAKSAEKSTAAHSSAAPSQAARYQNARFSTSVRTLNQLPPDRGREAAFAGRSNAGKSSALNALTGQKRLAKISKTPGRTQLINFFQLAEERYLVDLPGYGYAKVPEAMRRHWQTTLSRYLDTRQALRGLILLMDIRHPLTPLDRQMLAWCGASDVPAHVLLTKADKLKRGPAIATLKKVSASLACDYPLATSQLFSAVSRQGLDQARDRLDDWLFGD